MRWNHLPNNSIILPVGLSALPDKGGTRELVPIAGPYQRNKALQESLPPERTDQKAPIKGRRDKEIPMDEQEEWPAGIADTSEWSSQKQSHTENLDYVIHNAEQIDIASQTHKKK